MDRWTPLAPSKPGVKTAQGSVFSTARLTSVLKPTLAYGSPGTSSTPARTAVGPFVGRLPETVYLHILQFLPVSDFPSVARANRAFSRLARDERAWQGRCKILDLKEDGGAAILTEPVAAAQQLPTVQLQPQDEDDFGDFSSQSMSTLENTFEDIDFDDSGPPKPKERSLMDFDDVPLPSRAGGSKPSGFFAFSPPTQLAAGSLSRGPSISGSIGPSAAYERYKAYHLSMIPLCRHLRNSASPSATLALLFPPSPQPPSLQTQSKLLLALIRFLSPAVQPVRDWGFLRQALLAAVDRFDSACLVAFETADSRKDEAGMKEAAISSWAVWHAGGGRRDEWECGRVWVEKREILYEGGKWDPLANIVNAQTPTGATIRQLDFTPMDSFMNHILATVQADGQLASRVFPKEAYVLLAFCERLASDIIGDYIQPLLSQARVVSTDLYLRATAASFVQAWRLMDVACGIQTSSEEDTPAVPRKLVEDVIYRMFEVHMDEYLDEETDAIKAALDSICQEWDNSLGVKSSKRTSRTGEAPTFLNAANPDQVKRNVLAGFKDVLLLPVTIVPRTVTFGVNAIVTGGAQAVNGLAMLNPQRWASQGSGAARVPDAPEKSDGAVLFDVPALVEDAVESEKNGRLSASEDTLAPQPATLAVPSVAPTPRSGTPLSQSTKAFDRLQLLVSLDTALELIHADRESLKRAETFAGYPGKYGVKVREAIEEIFILLLQATSDRHIAPGFQIATRQMGTYKPAEHEETTSVAPLLQFFELVHIGDTIQSMVQVYFDKEMTQYVDRTDFLNSVMREKKRFESILDDAVASGLNAGIEVLMNQVEHIIQVKTGPREYYPVEGAPMDLGPTKGCQEAIACLETHCSLLKGSTSKDVLEVFYQEVGIRLQAILQRHLKRQIISLEGGFQIIADLNAYHAFVASLKQQRITDDFSNLKMLGHVFIVSDAKDLAQIVRDVTRYGGTFRPEDIYEFIQRRSDWKKIEKTVDKAMYALSVKEDCVVM